MSETAVINLTKGQKVNLTKESGTALNKLYVGLGWDMSPNADKTADLDAVVVVCDAEGKALSQENFVYFGNKTAPGIQLSDDNLTGEGDGDDEWAKIDLTALAPGAVRVVVAVNIYDGIAKGQTFGMVDNAMMHIQNGDTNEELGKFEMDFDASGATTLVFCEILKRGEEWYVSAKGEEVADFQTLCKSYGLNC